MQTDWQKFSRKAIKEVRQRVQTIVVYEEHDPETDTVKEVEAVVFSYDRPMQAEYT